MVVSRYIYPALAEPTIHYLIPDQYAFRPIGSTCTALIDLLQKADVVRLNEYVAIFSIDFTKAFDQVRHHARTSRPARSHPQLGDGLS